MQRASMHGPRRRRCRRALGWALIAVLGGCGGGDPLLPPCGALVGPRRQVVLVTIDTLRTDRLGVYGSTRETSPFIDRLAREGVQFMRAYAPAPITVASHVSMLTGLPPHEHGAIRNVERIRRRDVPSLPAYLRGRGYATAAFVSVPFLEPRAKRLPGFAHSEHPPVGEQWGARETFRRAAGWVRTHANEAFFVWLHAYDPHKPYAPPPPYDTLFWREAPESWVPSRSGIVRNGAPTPREIAYMNALYDGEIRATDAALEEFFATVRDALSEPPLVVVAADHGEVLEEQVQDIRLVYFHGKYPYNQALSVPLIMHWPGHLVPARRWEPVDITGIAPTISALLFDDPLETAAAPFPGVVPGEAGGVPGPLFAFAPRAATKTKLVAGWDFRAAETWSILRWPWHLIHNPQRGTFLYDLARDPLELRNRVTQEPERAARLRAETIAHFSGVPPDAETGEPVDERLRKQLESLGYAD